MRHVAYLEVRGAHGVHVGPAAGLRAPAPAPRGSDAQWQVEAVHEAHVVEVHALVARDGELGQRDGGDTTSSTAATQPRITERP